MPDDDERNWIEAYRECSADLRHYMALSWEIPSAVLVIVFLVLQLVFANNVPLSPVQKRLVISAAGIFGFILTLNFVKYVYRSDQRIHQLQGIENKHKELGRFLSKEPWYIRCPLGYPMAIFLLIVSFGLLAFGFLVQ